MEEKRNKLLIKNMVCQRCVLTVENIFNDLRIPFHKISLGEVDLQEKLTDNELKKIDQELNRVGLNLLKEELIRSLKILKRPLWNI